MVLFNHFATSNSILQTVLSVCDTSLTLSDSTKELLKTFAFLGTAVKPDIRLSTLVESTASAIPFLFAPDAVLPPFTSVLHAAGKRWALRRGLRQAALRDGAEHGEAVPAVPVRDDGRRGERPGLGGQSGEGEAGRRHAAAADGGWAGEGLPCRP